MNTLPSCHNHPVHHTGPDQESLVQALAYSQTNAH
jgi:hypothetical protein